MTALYAANEMPPARAVLDWLGLCFWTLPVSVAAEVKQLALPHSYPEGQHPSLAPASALHMNQPPAQVALAAEAGTFVAGTTTVIPLETSLVADGAGHEYVWQSRSVRQHPPP